MTRLLFIISRNDMDRYPLLKRAFADAESVEIVLDRRFGERRRRQASTPVERRRNAERRTRDITDDAQRLGWAIVRR